MTGVSRGGTIGGGRGCGSRGSAAARRNRVSEKTHDDKGFVQTAAVAASVSRVGDGGWFSLNKYTNAVSNCFDNWDEADWKLTCTVLKDLYDECQSKAGKGHPRCQEFSELMKFEQCDACPKKDQGGAVSGFRYSFRKFLLRGNEDTWDINCRHLKLYYDQCRSYSGDDHPKCQYHRNWMINAKCDDYLKKSDEEAADTSFRSSIRRFLWYMSERLDIAVECGRIKSLYDECRRDLGNKNLVCQDLRKRMIEEKCDGDLRKSDKEAVYPSSINKFFRNVDKKLDSVGECERLHDLYVKCLIQYGANICQDYLKHMSENKCPHMKNSA